MMFAGTLTVKFKRFFRFAIAICSAIAMSCSDPAITGTSALAVVELAAPAQSVRAGATLTMSVTLKDKSGKLLDNVPIYWSSSNVSVAGVSSTGVLTASAAGQVTIAVTALGKSATTTITVLDREVAAVQIAPASVSVRIGTTVALVAQTIDAEGTALSGRAIAWSSSNNAIATVSNQGTITGVTAGTATITATSEGKTGTAAVTVTLNPVATITLAPGSNTLGVGTNAPFIATLRDAGGVVLTNRVIAWNSSNVQVATVSSTGVVTGLSAGAATVSAVSEGRVGTASIVVLARLASTVTLTPSTANIIIGSTLQLASQVTDPSGNILPDRPITYASDNSAIASVNGTGLVTALAPGAVKITANSEGKTGLANIVVSPLPVATVQVTPGTATVLTGTTRQLNFEALSTTGSVLSGRNITWTSGAPSVASVSASGLVTPLAPGIALIVGVVEGVAGFSTITVQHPAIASLTITGGVASIAIGQRVQLVATARDNVGATLSDRVIIWATSNDNVAFVSSTGAVVGVARGFVTITATSEGVSGTFVISVN